VLLVGLLAALSLAPAAACASSAGSGTTTTATGTQVTLSAAGTHTPTSKLPAVPVGQLPVEARQVLNEIDHGGPFRYAQDGTVFGNFEGRLPGRPSGYYHEYTVPTPGARDRGARRLIAGRDGDVFYTADHYATFRQVSR
jgi:ribonuclease T1